MSRSDWPTVGALLDRIRDLHGPREAVVDSRRRLSYRDFASEARRLGSGLRAAGYGDGDRIAFLGDNSSEYLAAYYGVPAAGLVLLPLNARLAAAEIGAILEDAECSAVIVGRGYEERIGAVAMPNLRLIGIETRLDDLDYAGVLGRGHDGSAAEGAADDMAYMYYTSGTTGRPKGVMLTHANVMSGSMSAMPVTGMHAGSTWLHAGPMFHLADAFTIWGLTWLGGRHVCMRFEPEAAVRLIATERVTHTLLVPTAVALFAEACGRAGTRMAGLRSFFYGGAPMPSGIFRRAREHLDCPFVATYGMTETSGYITSAVPEESPEPDWHANNITNVGREVPLAQLRFLDDNGVEVAPGDVGEIVVTSPAVMAGYWRRPEETASVLSGRTLRTGDMGRRESDGTIALVDRKKDMIITGGENVYPREVELALETHPAIAEAAVIGRPDPHWGETVCAYLRLQPDATVSADEIRVHARALLAGYKTPRSFEFVADLPRTASGKVTKSVLKQSFATNKREDA